jgi:hypothetical protein
MLNGEMELADYRVNDFVYHVTPSGIKYIGVVKSLDFYSKVVDVSWYDVPKGRYVIDSLAAPDRIEWIGRMPEGVY